jgi:hypothetical protein
MGRGEQTMKKTIERALVAALTVAALCLGTRAHAAEQTGVFKSPEEAVKALAEAIEARDDARSEAMFGKGWREMLGSGDPVADREDALHVREMILEKVVFEDIEGNRKVLVIGNVGWPFTIPLVKEGELWRFDVKAGAEELLNRRVGRNELLTLATLHAYVDAQREYQETGRDGNPPAFAQKLLSDEGRHNGLYWATAPGEPESPMGDLVAQAAAEGYRGKQAVRDPYHGYLYRILTAQGKSAPGGAKSYLDEKGLMTKGFGAVAWPASYGKGGVMTFIVNQQGIVFQKDLGAKTGQAAEAITAYDPDETWNPTGD